MCVLRDLRSRLPELDFKSYIFLCSASREGMEGGKVWTAGRYGRREGMDGGKAERLEDGTVGIQGRQNDETVGRQGRWEDGSVG